MKNKIATSKLYNLLPSFYQNNVLDTKFINTLLDSYVEIGDSLKRTIENSKNTLVLDNTEYYKVIPMSAITLQKGLYNIANIAEDFNSTQGKSWFAQSTTLVDKVNYLKSREYYEDLTTTINDKDANVISLNIMRDFSETLSPYTHLRDYVVLDNKLFLFNELARPMTNGFKTVLIRDVVVDYSKLESKWGYLVGIGKPYFLSKYQYFHILKGMIEVYANGAKISNLKNAIKYISSSKDPINVYDKYSLDLPILYKQAYDEGTLNNFDFVVELPAHFIFSANTPKYIFDIIRMLKPAHTDFSIYSVDKYQENYASMLESLLLNTITKTVFETVFQNNSDYLTLNDANLVDSSVLGATYILTKAESSRITLLNKSIIETYSTADIAVTMNSQVEKNNIEIYDSPIEILSFEIESEEDVLEFLGFRGNEKHCFELNTGVLNGDLTADTWTPRVEYSSITLNYSNGDLKEQYIFE